MCRNLVADSPGRLGHNASVATEEGILVRKWRESLGLTQEKLGESCPKQLARNRICSVEKDDHSLTVATLINLIHGLERGGETKIGTTDRLRLSAFFLGPDGFEAQLQFVAKARAVVRTTRGVS